MDAITRVSYYFPTHTLTLFQILSNLVINDSSNCEKQERDLIIAMLVLFALACFFSAFTDTYTASNGTKFWVFMMPFYGPMCFSLPTDEDKDRVYDYYYLKVRDYVHGILATSAFVLIMIFTNPTCMCVFPSGENNGTSRFDAAIVRTVPIVVALITGMLMVCLGPPRQLLGFQNVPETCPPLERPMNSNPMYAGSHADYPPTIPEGDEDYESSPGGGGPPPSFKGASQGGASEGGAGMGMPVKQSMARSQARESYQSQPDYRASQRIDQGRQSGRNFNPMPSQRNADYRTSDGGHSGGYRDRGDT